MYMLDEATSRVQQVYATCFVVLSQSCTYFGDLGLQGVLSPSVSQFPHMNLIDEIYSLNVNSIITHRFCMSVFSKCFKLLCQNKTFVKIRHSGKSSRLRNTNLSDYNGCSTKLSDQMKLHYESQDVSMPVTNNLVCIFYWFRKDLCQSHHSPSTVSFPLL